MCRCRVPERRGDLLVGGRGEALQCDVRVQMLEVLRLVGRGVQDGRVFKTECGGVGGGYQGEGAGAESGGEVGELPGGVGIQRAGTQHQQRLLARVR